MGNKKIKVIGEGGAHLHRLESPTKTLKDGIHKHLFFVQDRLIMTELDGEHWHPINAKESEVGAESQPKHIHRISIRTQEGIQVIETDSGTPHPHELQVENTTLSGLHTHILDINEQKFVSLLPGDLISEVQNSVKNKPGLKDYKIKRDKNYPVEMDFALIKRLNSPNFNAVLKEACLKALIKNLSRLGDGLRIQSLVLSRQRFVDIGQARRFVMDHGLNVRASEERDDAFTFMVLSNDKFQEATLIRVRLTEGVEAVVGFLKEELQVAESLDASAADSLTENAVQNENQTETRTDTLDSFEDNEAKESESMLDMKKRIIALKQTYLEKQESLVIQTLLFDKKKFSRSQAVSWAKDHDFKSSKVDETENFFRLRQRKPNDFKRDSFRTKELTSGIKGVFGRLKAGVKKLDSDIVWPLHLSFNEFLKQLELRKGTKFKSLKYDIVKQDEEKRLVMGPVLIPESIDLQDEIVSAEEIENAGHNYMIKLTFQNDPEFLNSIGLDDKADRGFMHVDFSRKIAVVESYMAPVNFEINGRKIVKGTWVMTVKVFDDEVWILIKTGKITGFSIGGRARLIEEGQKTKCIEFTPNSNMKWEIKRAS